MWLRAGLVAVLALGVTAFWVSAQSLGEIARREEARRKTVKAPSKVYTNDSLRPVPGETVPTPPGPSPAPDQASGGKPPGAGAGQPPGSPPPPPDPRKEPEYWRKRMAEAQLQRERNSVYLDALQSRINALLTDFTARDDPAQRAVIASERQRALDELARLQTEQQDLGKAIADLEEEARRAGVPAGWLR